MVHKQKEQGSIKEIYRIQKYDIKDNEKTHNFQKGLQLPKKQVLLFFLSNIYISIWGKALEREKESESFQISPSCLIWLIYPKFNGIYEGKF